MMDDDKQPTGRLISPTAGVPKLRSGGERSVARLRQLKFDPIEELVNTWHKLKNEIELQEAHREGRIIPLTLAGKEKAFVFDHLMTLYDKKINVEEKLLRYGYGRVPEIAQQQAPVLAPLVVNLTAKGAQYIAGDVSELMPDPQFDDEDEDEHPYK